MVYDFGLRGFDAGSSGPRSLMEGSGSGIGGGEVFLVEGIVVWDC